jgi:ABC-type transport system involved in multi-copper enzyme maturation permease subunit
MAFRVGFGPVFVFEWLTATRRWQMYAWRSGFVGVLLLGLWFVWMERAGRTTGNMINAQAEIARYFYQTLVSVELVMILLAAPAATAGAICLDKARGTLFHVLVTDLSDAEIVLGKLAARLVPVLGLIGCSLPVAALGTLLGGIDPVALTGSFVVLLGVAVLGCTLALALSVWGKKTHEVLLATYFVWILWVLAAPIWQVVEWYVGGSWTRMPDAVFKANPFALTIWANDPRVPWSPRLEEQFLFLAAAGMISAGLVALTWLRLRPVIIRQWGRVERVRAQRDGARPVAAWVHRVHAALSPKLDGNPVLWREWHRRRPSTWARVVWGLYLVLAVGFSGIAIDMALDSGRRNSDLASVINGFQACIGLLLLSVVPATSLSEERVRGSLDVLLATPLPTATIVWGKWWGAFRGVPLLAILPGLVAFAAASRSGRWIGPPLIVGLVLAYGAAITSLGLALATWIPQPSRVLALCVGTVVGVTVGSIPMAMILCGDREVGGYVAMASPFFGVGYFSAVIEGSGPPSSWPDVAFWGLFWLVFYATVAVLLLKATLASFDRCLGRISEAFAWPGIHRVTRKPKRARLIAEEY